MEVRPLNWGKLADVAISGAGKPLIVLLDRVTDPHNVGAVLRSAEVFGARAVVAPRHHSAPETGALAKTASGALERQPYLKVTNLAEAMEELRGTELARAREVWARKFGEPATEPKEKARQIRFLVSRGFAAEVVRRVVQGAGED